MTELTLKTVTRRQGNNAALKDGLVKPTTVDLDFVEIPVLVEGFRRMVRQLEFDVCEMAITTYLCAKEHGVRFTALPIFLVRAFHHGAISYNPNSSITNPKELEGRSVGVNRGYTVTTGVWARSILQEEYDVDLSKVTWVRSGDEHVAEYVPPENVVPMDTDTTLGVMLEEGKLAAVIGAELEGPNIAPLISNPEQAGYNALRRTGLYPINHLVVVRDELLDAHPEIAADIFNAFAQSKDIYVEQLREGKIESPTSVDLMHQEVMEITGGDPLPYGIEPNRAIIERLIEHALTQQILNRRPVLEELFAAGTLDLTAD